MIWTREEYLAHMTFEASPREMFCELFGPLVGLDAEWRAQGASEDEISLRAFGWDSVKYAWAPADTGARTGIAPCVLEETATHVYSIDKMGRKMQMCKQSASLPLPMSYPVTCPEDWESIRRWYDFAPERIDLEQLKRLKALQKEGTLVVASMPGGFDEPRGLMGEENLCYAFYDEPEMIHDMLGHMADTCLKVFERVLDFVTIDVLSVHEDMAGKTGPLAGSKQVCEFIAPYYRKVWEPLKAQGCRLFSQDSDGNMNRVIDDFLDAGVNCMYPAEPMAGMDILALRKKYGKRLAFKGGLDKFALRGSVEDVRRELETKMQGELLGGGTVFALDHRIPNGVPIENYRAYVRMGRELLGLPPAQPADHVRMAF